MLYKKARISLACWYRATLSPFRHSLDFTITAHNIQQSRVQHRAKSPSYREFRVFVIIFYLFSTFLWLVRLLSCRDHHRKCQTSDEWGAAIQQFVYDEIKREIWAGKSKSTAVYNNVGRHFRPFQLSFSTRMSQAFQAIFVAPTATAESSSRASTMDRDSSTLDVRIIFPSTIWNIIFIRVISFAR